MKHVENALTVFYFEEADWLEEIPGFAESVARGIIKFLPSDRRGEIL